MHILKADRRQNFFVDMQCVSAMDSLFMRPSQFKHPLSVLRVLLGLGQREMAEVAGCSTATIQAVELRKLRMSDDLASRVSLATGVSVAWLLDGNPAQPISDRHGKPYSKDVFERVQATKMDFSEEYLNGNYAVINSYIFAILSKLRNNPPEFELATYKIIRFCQELTSTYDCKHEVHNPIEMMTALADGFKVFSEQLVELMSLKGKEADDFAETMRHSSTELGPIIHKGNAMTDKTKPRPLTGPIK